MNDYLIVTLIVLLYFSPVFYQVFLLIKDRKEESKPRQFDDIVKQLQEKYNKIDQDTDDHLYGLLYYLVSNH